MEEDGVVRKRQSVVLPPIPHQRGVLAADAASNHLPAEVLASMPSRLQRRLPNSASSASMPALPSPNGGMQSYAGPGRVLQPVPQTTVQKFQNYRKLARAHRGSLERGPRWRSETKILELANRQEADKNSTFRPDAASWAADAHSAHVHRRRDLQRQLREAKDFIDMREKRGFVPGLVASEDVSHHMASEQRKVASSMLRIEGAIRDCSKARLELVTMQKKMAAAVSEEKEITLKKKAGGDLRAALGGKMILAAR